MAITLSSPITVPERTFDGVWVKSMSIESQLLSAADPAVPQVVLNFTLVPYNTAENGTRTFSDPIDYIQVVDPDLYATAANNEGLQTLISDVVTSLGAIATAQGKI